jgi:hypothetical protein
VSVLAIALLGWFLRHADLSDVWQHVRGARAELLLLALVFVGATYWARAIRWRILLAPVGTTRYRTVFRTTIIGFAALGVLPVRAGDVLRPYLLARQERLSVPATLATVVMERVLDLVAVLVLLAVYVWGFADRSALPARLLGPIEAASAAAAATAAALLAAMWLLASHPDRVGTLTLAATRVLPGPVARRVARAARAFSTGFGAARQARGFLLAVAWSFPVWLATAGETWLVTAAFGIAMPYVGAFLLQGLLAIGVAMPTPGGVGSFHEAYRLGATAFFGAPDDRAVAAALVLHVVSYGPVVLLGTLFMAQDGLSFGRLGKLARSIEDGEEPQGHEVPVLRPSRR